MQEAEDGLTRCAPYDTALGHLCSYTGLQLTLTRTGVSRQQWVDWKMCWENAEIVTTVSIQAQTLTMGYCANASRMPNDASILG